MFIQSDLLPEMKKLHKFALRLTGNTSDADDLLQSTVLRAIEKREYFHEGSDLFRWSSKIMFNLFVSNYRRKKKFETQYDPETFLLSSSVEPDQENKSALQEVENAMNHLSAEHREILIMICVQGMKYQEAAVWLNIPVGTVRSRLCRAREHLQMILATCSGHKIRVNSMSADWHETGGILEGVCA